MSPGAQRFVYWLETRVVRPLTKDNLHFEDRDDGDFLTEEGQLKHDLTVETEDFKYFGVNTNVF